MKTPKKTMPWAAMLALLLLASPAWAQLSGSGTVNDPYIISSVADWNTFCTMSPTYANASDHYRLDADITISQSKSRINGEFDGNGHTITINQTGNNWLGVFTNAFDSLYLHDLRVQGTITTTRGAVGGIVDRVYGNRGKIIENCVVSVDFRGNHTGTMDQNNTIGGFIGEEAQHTQNEFVDGITLRNCVFNGSTPYSGRFDGGFVGYPGYRSQNNNSTVTQMNLHLENCVFAPREMSVIPNYTFSNNIGTAQNIYYTIPGTHVQGDRVYDLLPADGVYTILAIPFKNLFNYFYLPQDAVSFDGLQTTYSHTGSPIALSYSVFNNSVTLAESDYTAVIKDATGVAVQSVTAIGEYRLEVTIPNVGTFARAFYVTGPLTTVNGVYQINNVADWMTFANDVAGGNSYNGATLQLNADISTGVMVGTAEHKFSGTFNGNNHTITFNKTTAEDGCAPFRYIAGATISSLNIAGIVTSTGREVGGLAAYAFGINSISHCTVNSRITCQFNGDASNGGLIAHVNNDGGSTTFSYCTFKGCLYGSQAHSNGGFVGWSGVTLSFDNCLFNPAALNMNSSSSSTFARCNDIIYNHAYYLSTFGTAQGTKAYTSAQSSLCDKQTMGDGTDIYILRSSSIEGLAVTFEYAEGSDVDITSNVTVTYDGTTLDPSKYTFNLQTVQDVGRYTLTVSGVNTEGYYGSISKNFWVARTLPTDAEGFWLIDDMDDWLSLVCHVETSGGLVGGKVKMTADIGSDIDPVTKMISENSAYPFKGLFNGNGHTLTVNLNGNNEIGPFRYVNNATIVNLHVAGTIHGNQTSTTYLNFIGGIVGCLLGPLNISACRSSVDMSGQYSWYAGGLVGYNGYPYPLTMTDCLFDGIIRNNLSSGAGFVAFHLADNNTLLTMTNCLMNGTVVNNDEIYRIHPFYSYSWVPYPSNIILTNCLHKFATAPNCTAYFEQGAYTSLTGEALRAQMGDNWIVNTDGDVVPNTLTLYTKSITVADGIVHGTVIAPPASVEGQPVNLIVTPDEYYVVSSVTYNDGTDHNVSLQDNVYRFIMPNSNVTVNATFSLNPNVVPYIAYNTDTKTHDTRYRISPTAVASGTSTLGANETESWYKVSGDVTVSSRMTVRGTVNLILCDGATLTAQKGITVHNGDTLIVYGQEAGSGALVATGSVVGSGDGHESAAIGSEGGNDCRTGCITIHGGTITATGYAWTSAIGGGVSNGNGGIITIYGGTVHATADNPNYGLQEAIGKGSSGNNVNKALADGMRVTVGSNTTPVNYGDRIAVGLTNKAVTVERCTEHNFVDNVCTYCGLQHHYIVTYNGNGATSGSVPSADTILIGGDMTVTVKGDPDSLKRTGYVFTGWNTAANGTGTNYLPGETFTVGDMVTLYAQWQIINYDISCNLNGGWYAGVSPADPSPNPTTYTVEDGDITLVNPTLDGYDFAGWTGTDLDNVTNNVTIPHGSTGHRGYTATWTWRIPRPYGMDIDADYASNELGYYYVKMPGNEQDIYDENWEVIGTIPAEHNPKTVTIPDGFTHSFKVYDSGGKNGDYSESWNYYDYEYNDNEDGEEYSTLTLTCPEGYVFRVQGTIDTYEDCDYLNIYDGASINSATILDGAWGEQNIGPIYSSGNSITFYFVQDGMDDDDGFDLTVSLVAPPTPITLVSDDSQLETSQKNITKISENVGKRAIVTINGRTLYRDGSWNTLCLPFDINDISTSPLKNAIVKSPSSIELANDGSMTMNLSDANSIEAGKPYIVKWMDIAPQYTVLNNGDSRLFDGAVGESENEWESLGGSQWEFELSGTMTVSGYTLTTSREIVDNWGYTYPENNPTAWTLEASTDRVIWTTIDSRDVQQNPEDALPVANNEGKSYSVNQQGPYRYFRFTIIGDEYYELGDFSLQGTFNPDNIVNPTFKNVTIKNEQHPFASGDVTFAGNYSTLASTSGLMLDVHNAGAHAFHASLNLPDRQWCTDAGHTTLATTIPFDPATGNVTLYANYIELSVTADGWQAISTPAHDAGQTYESIINVSNLTTNSYDMFRYNESLGKWENQKASAGTAAGFTTMECGRGYIYRRSDATTLVFNGQPNSEATYSIGLTASGSGDLEGFNLVGNPYPYKVFVNRAFYELNADGSWLAHLAGDSIARGQGILVHASAAETLTFYAATRSTNPGTKGYLPPLPKGLCLGENCDDDAQDAHSTHSAHFAHISGDHIVITGTGTLQAFDLLGRRLFTKELSTLNSQLSTLNFPSTGVYLLRLNDKTQKIVIK